MGSIISKTSPASHLFLQQRRIDSGFGKVTLSGSNCEGLTHRCEQQEIVGYTQLTQRIFNTPPIRTAEASLYPPERRCSAISEGQQKYQPGAVVSVFATDQHEARDATL